jgi:hypothetical protein
MIDPRNELFVKAEQCPPRSPPGLPSGGRARIRLIDLALVDLGKAVDRNGHRFAWS